MALNQFGAVMTFAVELEEALAAFYTAAAAALPDHAEELRKRSGEARKRSQKLQRSRRNDITEITLEPIEGLAAADYALDTSSYSPASIDALERNAARFYADAAPKINVREARRLLERCQQEHNSQTTLAN